MLKVARGCGSVIELDVVKANDSAPVLIFEENVNKTFKSGALRGGTSGSLNI
jgi:hypothetical protein